MAQGTEKDSWAVQTWNSWGMWGGGLWGGGGE